MRATSQLCLSTAARLLLGLCVLWFLNGCGADKSTAPPAAPLAALSSGALSFAPTTVGAQAAASTINLTNTGGSLLQLNGQVLSDTTDFSFTTTCGATLAPDASCAFTVQFEPHSAAALTGTLVLTDNSGSIAGAQQVVVLSGVGTPVPVPQAGLAPSTLSFGQSVLGVASATQVITLNHTGSAELALANVTLSDVTDFRLAGSTCGSSLAPGATCTVSVVFSPQTVGPVSGTLTVTSNSGGVAGSQQMAVLSGTGLPILLPQVSLSASSLSFAGTVVKTSSTPQVVMLSNTGTAPLTIGGVTLTDTTDYTLVSNCGTTLPAGATCTLSITFAPQTTGPIPASLKLTDNSGLTTGTAQQTISLGGTGLPVPTGKGTLTPVTGAFGTVNVGSVSQQQMFTLTNSGTAALALSGVTLSDTKNFSLTNSCGATLPAGAGCTISVLFQPQSAGVLNASLIVNDDSDGLSSAQQVAMLSGTGVALPAPQAVLTPSALSFPDTMVSLNAAPQTLTLTNAGNAPLSLSGVTLSDTQDFSFNSNCPAVLAPAAACSLSIGFQPKTVAALQAVLTLADNSGSTDLSGPGTTQQTVSIVAKGTAFDDPRAVASPSTLTFPQTVTNSSAPAQSVTLTNTGTEPLTFSGVTLSGTSAAAFQIASGDCSGSLAAGASCTESILYNPKLASASDTASLIFTDNALGQTNSTQTVALSGSALAEVDSVENFGDSITCGFYATPHDGTGLVWSMEGYAGLFDTQLGVPSQNWCRQGDTAADLSRLWVPFHSTPDSTSHQLFTLMIGVNDAYRYGIAQVALQTYTAEVAAAVSWLAIPNSDKVLANAITQQTGSWNQDVGFGMMSTDTGASLTFNVNQATAGRNLYLVYHVWAQPYGQAGKASIAVDGTVQATVDESQNSGVYIPTENGTYDTFLVQQVPLGAVGPHTVSFSSVGPAGSAVGLLWAGVAQGDYRNIDGAPQVLVGYVTNSPSGNQTFAADNYSLQLMSLIPTLVADGMNVKGVNTTRVMDPNTDFADILHPNNSGHAKLAAAFTQAR